MQNKPDNDRSKFIYLRTVSAITWKDLVAELRSRELISAMLVFALLVILIFNFAIELQPSLRISITPGILWVTFAFAGTIGLNRSMAVEKDRGCLDGLLLAPVDRSAIYFGKVLSNLAFMLIVVLVVLPIYSILYNINVLNITIGSDYKLKYSLATHFLFLRLPRVNGSFPNIISESIKIPTLKSCRFFNHEI